MTISTCSEAGPVLTTPGGGKTEAERDGQVSPRATLGAHATSPTVLSPRQPASRSLRLLKSLSQMSLTNTHQPQDPSKGNSGSARRGAAETNRPRNHEVAGLIPGLAPWVRDPALLWCRSQMWLRSWVAVAVGKAGSCSCHQTPGLGTSICHGSGPKKQKKKGNSAPPTQGPDPRTSVSRQPSSRSHTTSGLRPATGVSSPSPARDPPTHGPSPLTRQAACPGQHLPGGPLGGPPRKVRPAALPVPLSKKTEQQPDVSVTFHPATKPSIWLTFWVKSGFSNHRQSCMSASFRCLCPCAIKAQKTLPIIAKLKSSEKRILEPPLAVNPD